MQHKLDCSQEALVLFEDEWMAFKNEYFFSQIDIIREKLFHLQWRKTQVFI